MNTIAAILFTIGNMFYNGNHAKIMGYRVNGQTGGAALEEGEGEGEGEGLVEDEPMTTNPHQEAFLRTLSREELITMALQIEFYKQSSKPGKTVKKGKKPVSDKETLLRADLERLLRLTVDFVTPDETIKVNFISTESLILILIENRPTYRRRIIDSFAGLYMDYRRGDLKIVFIDGEFTFVLVGDKSVEVSASFQYNYPLLTGGARKKDNYNAQERSENNVDTTRAMGLPTSDFPFAGRPTYTPTLLELSSEYLKLNQNFIAARDEAIRSGLTLTAAISVGHQTIDVSIYPNGEWKYLGSADTAKVFGHLDGVGRHTAHLLALSHPYVDALVSAACDNLLNTLFEVSQAGLSGLAGLDDRSRTELLDLVKGDLLKAFHYMSATMVDGEENTRVADRVHASERSIFGTLTSLSVIKSAFCLSLARLLKPDLLPESQQHRVIMAAAQELADELMSHKFARRVMMLGASVSQRHPTEKELEPNQPMWDTLPGYTIYALPTEVVERVLAGDNFQVAGANFQGLVPGDLSTRDRDVPANVTRLAYNTALPTLIPGKAHEVSRMVFTWRRADARKHQKYIRHALMYGSIMGCMVSPTQNWEIWSTVGGNRMPSRPDTNTLPILAIRLLLNERINPIEMLHLKKQLELQGKSNVLVSKKLVEHVLQAFEAAVSADEAEVPADGAEVPADGAEVLADGAEVPADGAEVPTKKMFLQSLRSVSDVDKKEGVRLMLMKEFRSFVPLTAEERFVKMNELSVLMSKALQQTRMDDFFTKPVLFPQLRASLLVPSLSSRASSSSSSRPLSFVSSSPGPSYSSPGPSYSSSGASSSDPSMFNGYNPVKLRDPRGFNVSVGIMPPFENIPLVNKAIKAELAKELNVHTLIEIAALLSGREAARNTTSGPPIDKIYAGRAAYNDCMEAARTAYTDAVSGGETGLEAIKDMIEKIDPTMSKKIGREGKEGKDKGDEGNGKGKGVKGKSKRKASNSPRGENE